MQYHPTLFVLLLTATLIVSGCNSSPDHQGFSRAPTDDAFARGTDRDPSARTLHAMSRILASQYKDEESRYVLERCIDRYPQFAPAYCELAELHTRNGRMASAIETLEQARHAVPTDPVIVNNLGVCHLLDNRYEEALAMFDEAVELDSENARYQANRALAMGMLGRYSQTLDAYREILPEGEAHYNLAVLYEANRERTKAEEHYRRAEALGYQPEANDDADAPTSQQ